MNSWLVLLSVLVFSLLCHHHDGRGAISHALDYIEFFPELSEEERLRLENQLKEGSA